jgi:hypothetical protein
MFTATYTTLKCHNQEQHILSLQNVHSPQHYITTKNSTFSVFRMFTATYTTLYSVITKNSRVSLQNVHSHLHYTTQCHNKEQHILSLQNVHSHLRYTKVS